MYPGGYGGYGGYCGGHRGYGGGYGGYGGPYGGGYGGGYGVDPYQAAQVQRANMRRAYAAQRQQAQMYRAQQENVRRVQTQHARMQQAYRDQFHAAQAQQQRYMRRAQAEQADRNRESTQNSWMHYRQPRGHVDPDSLHSSEADEPRARRSGRDRGVSARPSARDRARSTRPSGRGRDGNSSVDDLREEMCRLGLMSGGLGDRDDDFVRPSTRRERPRREHPRRSRTYDESSEEDDNVYERYHGRSRRDNDFTSRMASMFGGRRSGRY